MRTLKAIAVVVTILVGVPGVAAAQDATDEKARQAAEALPERLWEPASEPVSGAGPTLPEDGSGISPWFLGLLLVASVGAGYAISQLRPVAVAEPVVAPAPALEPPPERLPTPERPPAPVPLPVVADTAVARETCAIALAHAWGRGRFEVRVKSKRGAHRVVTSSLAFEVPRGMVIAQNGPAGRAHRRLLLHLAAAGWELEPDADGPWYERRLSRPVPGRDARDVDRALVSTRPGPGEAEFVALALDDFGNARELMRSPRFARPPGRPVEETEPALAAHGTLLEDLEAHGWRVSGTLESWYGATLARRRSR